MRSARTTTFSSPPTRTRTATPSGRCWLRSWRSTRSARTRSCTWPARRRCRASTTDAARRPAPLAPRRRSQPRGARPRLREREPSRPRSRGASQSAPLVINVDHHHDNSRFGAVNLVVADASSTGEIVRDLLDGAGRRADAGDRGGALHRASSPTPGRFQYTNTTPKALRLAAELVEAGADVHKIFQDVYESVQFAKLKLLAPCARAGRDLRGKAIRN